MGRRVAWDALYSTARWARLRRHQLQEHPLCKFCLERGIVELATICDHVEPHRGDRTAFFHRCAAIVVQAVPRRREETA